MHSYESKHGVLPPAAVTNKDGKPLLSWRVLMLPYVEEGDLYNQFHLDEPWDSPHNITLLDKMPRAYTTRARRMKPPPNTTYVQVFVGPNTPFEPGKKITLDDFKRGTSNTILLIEAGDPVLWTKPADIEVDPNGPMPNLKSVVPGLMRTSFADGSRHLFPLPVDENEIRGMIWLR
jgi:hypothetical protein